MSHPCRIAFYFFTLSLMLAQTGCGGGGSQSIYSSQPAQDISVNPTGVSGSIVADSSVFYRFHGTAGTTYKVALRTMQGDVDMGIFYGRNTDDVAEVVGLSAEQGSANDEIIFTATQTRDYFLEIINFTTGPGTYHFVLDSDRPPEVSVEYTETIRTGDLIEFQAYATDPDGDSVTFTINYGPPGMSIDDTGRITWQVDKLYFTARQRINWSIRAKNEKAKTDFTGHFVVLENSHKSPIVRSDIRASGYHSAGFEIDDFDGDGKNELLVTDGSRIYTLEQSDDGYVQDWVHPYSFGGDETVSSLTTADINQDGIPEIIYGLQNAIVGHPSRIIVFDGATKKLINQVSLGTSSIRDLAIGNLNDDGDLEIVVIVMDKNDPVAHTRLIVFDAHQLVPEWESAAGNYGHVLTLGNLDHDNALEFVTSEGHVFDYDGNTFLNIWTSPEKVRTGAWIGDVDGNGTGELILDISWEQVDAYDITSNALLWRIQENIGHLIVRNIDGDAADELILSDNWKIKALSYDSTLAQFTTDWSIDKPVSGIEDIAVGNLDEDPEPEFVWAGTAGHIVVAGLNPDISIEWQIARTTKNQANHAGGKWLGVGNGNGTALFASGGYGYPDNLIHTLALDSTGTVSVSNKIPLSQNPLHSLYAIDVDQNDVDEVIVARNNSPEITLFALNSDQPLWEYSANSGQITAIAQADLTSDGIDDLAVLYNSGAIRFLDVANQRVIWSKDVLGQTAKDIDIADLDRNTSNEILVAFDNEIIVLGRDNNSYEIKDRLPVENLEEVVVGDITGDINVEILVSFQAQYKPLRVAVYKSTLKQIGLIKNVGHLESFYIDPNAGQHERKNLVFVTGVGEGTKNPASFLRWVDPVYGQEIMHSPPFVGAIQAHSFNFADTNSDGRSEILFATDKQMYMTR